MESVGALVEFRRFQERRGLRPRSIRRQMGALMTVARWMEPRPLLMATREDVEAFLDSREIGPRTTYGYLSSLHGLFGWAVDRDLAQVDPTLHIPRPRMHRLMPRPAAGPDVARALAHGTPKQRCWVVLAALQGLRCQEIAGMRREDVLEHEDLLRVTNGKGGHERVLPLHPAVADELARLPMPRVGYLFHRQQGGIYSPERLSREFNAFLASAQVPATAHQLRHTFGTALYAVSKDLRLTQEMLGHSSPTTTAVYTAWDRGAAGAALRSLSIDGLPLCAPDTA